MLNIVNNSDLVVDSSYFGGNVKRKRRLGETLSSMFDKGFGIVDAAIFKQDVFRYVSL